MKYLENLIWVSGILAGLIMLLGAIDLLFLIFKVDLIPVNHVVNYFHVASSLLLLSICCCLFLILKHKKGEV